ncbi:MAG TPA: CHRD domain-containing protein [Acidimicrobiales bacterium]|nr:CHRD domain-containing protein [Acidimicrobiales bacterium]
MKLRTLAVGAAAAGILALTAAPAQAAHAEATTTVGLNGANEVPEKGDPNGSGKIDITVFGPRVINDGNRATVAFDDVYYLCYDLVTRNIDGVAAAHIHEVDRGEGQERTNPRKLTGGVVVDLQPGATETSDSVKFKNDAGQVVAFEDATSTCVTALDGSDDEVIDEMTREPREYYVNVHNEEFPAGAIRGQVNFETDR